MRSDLAPTAEAFGKVILLGEHSVVYGRPALAAGLPQGLQLRALPLPDSEAQNTLSIPAWALDVVLDRASDHPVVRAAIDVIETCGGPLTGWKITGETRLPAGAGLGSSAALTVALARLADPNASVEAIIEASIVGERVFHGQPSGLDSAVAARGGLLRFVRGEAVTSVQARGPLSLWILPSGVPRSTGVEVAKVRARYDRLPSIVEPMLDALAAAVGLGIESIKANNLEELGEIMNVSHELLSGLGVGDPALDRLVLLAARHGCAGAKLTGAGGGGCVVALPPED
ncbi:MAG TPA: mevalonate kinase, partial [Nannocystis exedens]|nr:mevalonate kinase [Nannocystis exedens]